MRRIGLIGGMSFESTAVYYRLINEAVRREMGGLTSADIVLHSLNFAEIVALQKADRWDEAARVLTEAGQGLERAGADCMLICTNTMHLVADAVAAGLAGPLVNIIDETGAALVAAGKRRPLLIATRYTMEHGFYAERMARLGVSVMVPDEIGRARVHDTIFAELCAGLVRDESRADIHALIEKAKAAGADSVILGCTEICLLVDPDRLALPGFDSTRIHAEAAVRFALGGAARAAA